MIKHVQEQQMINEKSDQQAQTYYLTNFSILDQADTELLCTYKSFIENVIMQLGEDWRIQSNLLSQQIENTIQNASVQETKKNQFDGDFNIFNEFLWCFLKGKIGRQIKFTIHNQNEIQEEFIKELSSLFFACKKINESLTFKTLSLGFFITAIDQWKTSFKHIGIQLKLTQNIILPFAILQGKSPKEVAPSQRIDKSSSIGTSTIKQFDNLDLLSCQMSLSELQSIKQKKKKKWFVLKSLDLLKTQEIRSIKYSLQKEKKNGNKKITVLSIWVVNIFQMQIKDKKFRILSLNQQFYKTAFVVWIMFNIKLFFSLRFSQFLFYFKGLRDEWDDMYERPLKKFHVILESEWSKLLKDYSVALHDDVQVLKNLIKRVRKTCFEKWQQKTEEIKNSIIKQ